VYNKIKWERVDFLAATLLYKIVQLFIFMILGFILAKTKVVKSSDSTVLSKISLYLLMPSAIINAFDFELSGEITNGMLLAFLAAVILHIVYLFLDKLFNKTLKTNAVERASIMYPNVGNLIIPIVTFVLGEEWVLYSTAFLSVQLVFLWTHAIRIFSPNTKFSIKKILLNVNIIAIMLGVILMVCPFRLPVFVKDITSTLSGMMGPIGMLIAGMVASSIDFKGALKNKRLYLTSVLRIVVYPFISLIVLKCLSYVTVPNVEKILVITFFATMTPSAAAIMQFAQISNEEPQYATAINILTTIMCIVSMPLFVAFYNLVI
jgi:predicted permease